MKYSHNFFIRVEKSFFILKFLELIYKLTYESNAKKDALVGIQDILKNARAKNGPLNITGCLVYHNGNFVQILEGKKKDVYSLYKTIEKDSRHSNVRLISEELDKDRSFSDWNMAYFDPVSNGFGKADLENFERNLLLLAEFSDRLSTTVNLFWLNVRKIVLNLKMT